MNDDIKAVTEVAKTSGKAIDASRAFGGFISKFISGPLEQGMGIFEDKLKYMRWERQVAIMEKVNKKMAERGLDCPTQAVPLKITVPLLQAASMEEDDDLQELWANLLVNAADKDNGIEVHRSYINILEELTSNDASILDKIYSIDLEYDVEIHEDSLRLYKIFGREEALLSLENLCRLRLLNSVMWSKADMIKAVYQTRLGRYFHEACSSKKV